MNIIINTNFDMDEALIARAMAKANAAMAEDVTIPQAAIEAANGIAAAAFINFFDGLKEATAERIAGEWTVTEDWYHDHTDKLDAWRIVDIKGRTLAIADDWAEQLKLSEGPWS